MHSDKFIASMKSGLERHNRLRRVNCKKRLENNKKGNKIRNISIQEFRQIEGLRAYSREKVQFWKNILSYTFRIAVKIMLDQKMDDGASIPLLNGVGFLFGLIGVVALFVQQSLEMFLPLLLPLVVCVAFCTLLFKSQQNDKASEEKVSTSPVRIDVIWSSISSKHWQQYSVSSSESNTDGMNLP